MKNIIQVLSLLLIIFTCIAYAQIVQFGTALNIENPKTKESSSSDETLQSYTLKGWGENIWFNHDEFHSLFKKIKGDCILIAKFFDEAPYEIYAASHSKVKGIEKKGIPLCQMTEKQKKRFLELLEVYKGNYIFDFSENLRNKSGKAGIENLSFVWEGGLTDGLS